MHKIKLTQRGRKVTVKLLNSKTFLLKDYDHLVSLKSNIKIIVFFSSTLHFDQLDTFGSPCSQTYNESFWVFY